MQFLKVNFKLFPAFIVISGKRYGSKFGNIIDLSPAKEKNKRFFVLPIIKIIRVRQKMFFFYLDTLYWSKLKPNSK